VILGEWAKLPTTEGRAQTEEQRYIERRDISIERPFWGALSLKLFFSEYLLGVGGRRPCFSGA
jgi:hypothetical protein